MKKTLEICVNFHSSKILHDHHRSRCFEWLGTLRSALVSHVHLTAVKYLQTNLALSLPVPCQTFTRRVRIGAYRNEKLSDFLTINTTLETAFPRVVNNNFAQSLRLAPPCPSRKRTCTGTLPCAIWVSVVQSGAKIITSSLCGGIGLIRCYH